jgi:hypothetical protein
MTPQRHPTSSSSLLGPAVPHTAASRAASAPERVRLGFLAIAGRVIATACVAVTIFESTTMGNR